MSYFHATAVFEAKGTSLEDADHTAAALFKSLRHNRLHYYEHDVTAGSGPYPPSKALYFSVIAEFDVDAGGEDRAGELADEALEALATDEVQFIAFGLTQGEQRVRPAERATRDRAEPERSREARDEGDEERKGRRRGSRSRGRKRKDERETEDTLEGQAEAVEEPVSLGKRVLVEEPTEAVVARTDGAEQKIVSVAPIVIEDETPLSPPPRSSEAMRVTLAMSFRASEFGLQPNGTSSPDQDEFLSRAIAEARARHPELPADVAPTHEIVVQPWGETVLTLTWAYDVPVPSASGDA